MIRLTETIEIGDEEIEITAVRSSGAGGQAVNKQSTAVHLRFDIPASSLPEGVKQRLLSSSDHRISADGVLVLKAREHRSQRQNRREALERLRDIIREATLSRRPRIPTRPGAAAERRRLRQKRQRAETKSLRRPPGED